MYPLFATGVVDTGGEFAAGVIDTGGNLPPVSTTLAKLVEKFAASFANTGGNLPPVTLIPAAILPPVSLIPVVHLDLRLSPRIFEKFETVLKQYSGAGGKLIHQKNQKQKIS